MIEIGSRARSQPPPPSVVYEALVHPNRDPARSWLTLLDDEQPPSIMDSVAPRLVVWSSLWPQRPDAVVRFDLSADASGTRLRWTLSVEEPAPTDSLVGHLRLRLNQLINANLRYTFGQ